MPTFETVVRKYVCLFCREPKTLHRLRPLRLYACPECIRELGGKGKARDFAMKTCDAALLKG